MIHAAFWVFAFCASIGSACLFSSDSRGMERAEEKAKRALFAAIAFVGAMAFFYMLYWSFTTPKGY